MRLFPKLHKFKKKISIFMISLTMVLSIGGIFAEYNITAKAAASSGTYYGINWTLDADGNLTLQGGTCNNTKGAKWTKTDVKTAKCDGEIICNDSFCDYLFSGCTSLTSLDVSNFNTSNVTYMSGMFNKCSSLTSLDVSNLNTDNATNMSYMFCNCNSLTSLDVSNFNTSNATVMSSMFSGCTSLTSLDVSNFNTSNVTYMSGMFNKCSSLTSLDVSNLNTSNVTYMSDMFNDCNSLTSLDVSNFNTSNVTYMSDMFNGCNSLTSLDVSNFNTSNVTKMPRMFNGCNSLTSLDVSNFNTSNVTDMSFMFQGCDKLTSLDVSNFNTNNVTSATNMLSWCDGLEVLTTPKAIGITINLPQLMYDDAGNEYTTFGPSDAKKTLYKEKPLPASTTWQDDWEYTLDDNANQITIQKYNGTETTYQVPSVAKIKGKDYTTKLVRQDWGIGIDFGSITSLSFEKGVVVADDMSHLFENASNLQSLDLSNLDTSNVTYMNGVFYNCSKLSNINLSNFNTAKVTNMQSMFNGCSSLQSLDLSKFNTSNVTNMSCMFFNCKSFTTLDLSSFNTQNVTNMGSMFNGCLSLQSLNLSSFDTSKVTDMSWLFRGCAFENIDISNFNTSNVTTMEGMFDGCKNLKYDCWSKLNTSKVTNVNYMFRDCKSITAFGPLDISSFDLSKVTSSKDMFCWNNFSGIKTPKAMSSEALNTALPHKMFTSDGVEYTTLKTTNTTLYDYCIKSAGITATYNKQTSYTRENIDLSELVIKEKLVTYKSDGSTTEEIKDIPATDVTLSKDILDLAGNNVITVTYNGNSTTFTVDAISNSTFTVAVPTNGVLDTNGNGVVQLKARGDLVKNEVLTITSNISDLQLVNSDLKVSLKSDSYIKPVSGQSFIKKNTFSYNELNNSADAIFESRISKANTSQLINKAGKWKSVITYNISLDRTN